MAVFDATPHRLTYYPPQDNGYVDDNGDYVQGEQQESKVIECRAVPAGKANELTFEDGVTRTYSFTVYLPVDCPTFRLGDNVTLELQDGRQMDYAVVGFARYTYKAKLWL